MRIMHSLRVRLILVMMLVALLPVGAAAYLIQRATADAFYAYSTLRSQTDAQAIVQQIDNLTGKPAVVVDVNSAPIAGSAGLVSASAGGANVEPGSAPVGYGGNGEKDATILNVESPANIEIGGVFESVEAGSASSGVVGIGGVSSDSETGLTIALPGLPDQAFLSDMNNALWIGVGLAMVGALLLAALLTWQILKPVESLTGAARGMAAGDMQRRAIVRGKSEIGELAEAFNSMAESRARLDELRRNLVNDVAHELRTPLSNLQGYLEVLRDGVTPPTPEVLTILHEESLLLSRLVGDLQELALAEAGELPLSPQSVALAEPVLQAIDAHRPAAGVKAVNLEAEIPEDLPLVSVDAARFSQILRNLLRNAIAHTPAGGSIEVRAAQRGREMVLSVRDTGVGIPPEHLPYIFDRFYRADPARARTTGGSGLGLAIVKHLVEAHGGRIDVASVAGSGSTFTFTLPLSIETPALAAAS